MKTTAPSPRTEIRRKANRAHYDSAAICAIVDAAFLFPDPANPWKTAFPEVANINNLQADVKADFVAVKIGDVNGSAGGG